MATIIFKATEACNSNCVYCDVVHRKKARTISTEVLKCAYERINEFLLEYPDEDMLIIWHGGEPCMAGIELYRTAIKYWDEICIETHDRIKYAVQTNLTMISQEFIDVFAQMGIQTYGTSYEPFPGIRGIGKKRDSLLYNRLFFKGVNLVEKNEASWGFIYVVTKSVLDKPLEVFHHLSNLKLKGGFDLHNVVVYDDAADESKDSAVSQKEFADFLGVIFKEWWENRDRYPDVQPFKNYLDAYRNGIFRTACTDAPWCGLHLYIGPDGNTAQCGRAADWNLLEYGNIKDTPLKKMFFNKDRELINSRQDVLPDTDCKGCEYWRLCHGGCPLDAYNKHKGFLHKTDQCESRKIFLKKYFEPITGLKLAPEQKQERHEQN